MRQPCPTDRKYPNDPQDYEEPNWYDCSHCGELVSADDVHTHDLTNPDGSPDYITLCDDCHLEFEEVD